MEEREKLIEIILETLKKEVAGYGAYTRAAFLKTCREKHERFTIEELRAAAATC